jgi:phenylalanyl-tRNA synthetase beta chain
MLVPVSWLREYMELPPGESARDIAARLLRAGLEVETVHSAGADISGPLVVGRVDEFAAETHSNGKTIRWCQVDVGEPAPRGIVCGAHNFADGDLVVVALPGAKLSGGFEITARRTYGHVSDGMICSARELGLGDDHTGILVLRPDEGTPGDDAMTVLALRDEVLDIAVTADRGYCLSIRGIAREVATAYGVPLRDPGIATVDLDGSAGYPVAVDDVDRCEVYVARTITDLDVDAASPRWMQRRIQLAGMRPISLAVDVTNYVMLELGQPIHGFDQDALVGPIVVRRATAGEKVTTLDGAVRDLDPDDLLITDDTGPIGLAGVMGGESTEMSPSTRTIVIEAANFEATGIARTARRHKLPSEASRRFERGVDPALPLVAATRVAELLVELGGASAAAGATVVGSPAEPAAIEIDLDLPSRVVGVDYAPADVAGLLAAVGGVVTPLDGARLSVVPPTWRPDLFEPFDLVEEVARLRGYDAIPSVLPIAPPGRGITFSQRLRRRIEHAVAAAGYVEAPSYPFIGPRDLDALGLATDDPRRRALRLANPLSDEEPYLRTTLLPGLLATLRRNVGRGFTDVALFESGLVFRPGPGPLPVPPRLRVDRRPTDDEVATLYAAVPAQPHRVAVVAAGDWEPSGGPSGVLGRRGAGGQGGRGRRISGSQHPGGRPCPLAPGPMRRALRGGAVGRSCR